ncbi:hypothetical protein D1831_01915 [Lactiplantibacillus garii]|uniref:Uncharacterized protein n=1 Tax=Lactiplantibacillus garii TaxID=2306423 RepID=A0A426DA80_9LACO|nr:hypothetical protein [Lactiplantibacillus garii]RRK11471.1 hypothetical protein D1831_01915 [Lactiplantibacillus garii]
MMRPSKPILNRQAARFAQNTNGHARHNQLAASDLAQTDQKRQVLRQKQTVVLRKHDHHVLRSSHTVTLSSKPVK